jgi:ribosomal protein S18 acetylase RimI-like enzyme
VIERARDLGYAAMFLDTSVEQREAIGLYHSLGFAEVEPYYDVPAPMRDWLVYFWLDL